MIVKNAVFVAVFVLLVGTSSGYSKQVRKITERAVVGDPFMISIILQDSAYFSDTVYFRNKSKIPPQSIASFSVSYSPFTCPGNPTGFTTWCSYDTSTFTYWINITKTSITMYDRWVWNVNFRSDDSDINTDIGTINPFKLTLTAETVMESSAFTVQCQASPKMNPHNLTMYRLRQYWGEEFIQERGVREGNRITMNLNWASYQDSGRYECTASTGEMDSDGRINHTVSRDVIVQAAPRPDVSHVTVFAKRGSNTVLTVTFLNTSYVTIRWSRDGRMVTNQNPGLETQERKYRVYEKNVTSRGIVTRLHATVDDDTLGHYDVTSCSDGGCASTSILLSERSSPELPQRPVNFHVEANVTGGVLLAWESGHDGVNCESRRESFYLAFRTSGDDAEQDWNYRPVEDSCPCLPVYYLLQGLRLNTEYLVKVQTMATIEETSYRSPFTDAIHISFEEPVLTRNDDKVVGAGIGLGVGVTLVAIALLIFVVVKILRGRRTNAPHLAKRTRDIHQPSGDHSTNGDQVTTSKSPARNKPHEKKEGTNFKGTSPKALTRGNQATYTPAKMYDQLSGRQESMSYEGLEIYQN